MDDYFYILQEWENNVAKPYAFEHVGELFPSYQFRRVNPGSPSKDHWASRYKLDLTIPRIKNAEKTVIYRGDLRFREQGDWDNPVGLMDLYMKEYGLSDIFRAYKHLSDRFGLRMPESNGPEVRKAVSDRRTRESLMDELVSYFCWNLENNKTDKAARVRSYLSRERGFTPKQIRDLNLGFVPDWNSVIRRMTIDKGFSLEDLDAFCGVRNSDGKTSVGKSHILAIPYECAGVIKGFIFRRIGDGDGPKYIATQELDRKSVLFNITADSDPKDIVIVEGEFDALKASAEGMENVVAIGGSEIAGERRSQVEDALQRRGVRRITLCLDLDAEKSDPSKAKRDEQYRHIMRSIHTIKDVDMDFDDIFIALFPEPSDPDEYIRSKGIDAFRKLVADAVPYWEYLFDYKKNK